MKPLEGESKPVRRCGGGLDTTNLVKALQK
jgi:hypothetical protein